MRISLMKSLFKIWSNVFKCVSHRSTIIVEKFCCILFLASPKGGSATFYIISMFSTILSRILQSIKFRKLGSENWVLKTVSSVFKNSSQESSLAKRHIHVPYFENLALKSNLKSSRKGKGRHF